MPKRKFASLNSRKRVNVPCICTHPQNLPVLFSCRRTLYVLCGRDSVPHVRNRPDTMQLFSVGGGKAAERNSGSPSIQNNTKKRQTLELWRHYVDTFVRETSSTEALLNDNLIKTLYVLQKPVRVPTSVLIVLTRNIRRADTDQEGHHNRIEIVVISHMDARQHWRLVSLHFWRCLRIFHHLESNRMTPLTQNHIQSIPAAVGADFMSFPIVTAAISFFVSSALNV